MKRQTYRQVTLTVTLPLLVSLTVCGPDSEERPAYRIAVAKFQHETCTFCPGGDTEIADWLKSSPILEGDDVLQSGSFIRGFTEQSRAFGDIELVPLPSPNGVYGGSSRSWNSKESFDYFLDSMLVVLKASLPVDGVYLALHGALAVRDVPRPEAEIARRFREVVGPDVPIAASFDLHGNEDEAFLQSADFAFVTKRYPHYDAYIQGERSAQALRRTIGGEYTPTTATRKPGIITATVLQWTGQSPSMDIMERARRWESRVNDAYVSVFYGYPWSDVPDVGATVQVMTNGDQEMADRIADDMEDFIWRVREEFAVGGYPRPAEAARQVAQAVREGRTPIAVGDHSDRPGDATHILKAFEAAGIENVLYGTITDPTSLEALEDANAQIGDSFSHTIGGFTPSGGTPVLIEGIIEYFGRGLGYDYVAAVSFGRGNLVVITPAYSQILFPSRFELGTVNPAAYDVFVVKSRVHFRRGFDETGFAPTIIVVEAPEPFVGTTFLDGLPYEHVDLRQLFPYGTPANRR